MEKLKPYTKEMFDKDNQVSKDMKTNVEKARGSRTTNKVLASKTEALAKKMRKHPAHRILGMSHKQWIDEGKPKAHY